MWKSEQQLLTLKYNIFRSFVPPEKYSYANLVNDEKNPQAPANIVMDVLNVLEKVEQ